MDRDGKILEFAGFIAIPEGAWKRGIYKYPVKPNVDYGIFDGKYDFPPLINLDFLAEYVFPQCDYLLIEKESNLTEEDLESGATKILEFIYVCDVEIGGKKGSAEDKQLLEACLQAVEQAIGDGK